MNRRTIILCISALAILAFLIAGAVAVLYSGDDTENTLSDEEIVQKASSSWPLLNAVPSDAAMVLCADGFRSGVSELMDSTRLFGTLFYGTGKSSVAGFVRKVASMFKIGELGSLKNSDMVISVHYSGDLVPLIIIDPGRIPSDSTGAFWSLIREADSSSVYHAVLSDDGKDSPLGKRTLLAMSTSESLVKSAERHVAGRISVLDDSRCAVAAASMKRPISVLLNHSYSGKLALSFLTREFSRYSGFIKTYADWSWFTMSEDTEKRLVMEGGSSSADSPKYFNNVFLHVVAGPSTVSGILPSGTMYASVITISDVENYMQAYHKYLDASGKLDKYNVASSILKKKYGVTPEIWAKMLNVKEICKAIVPADDGFDQVLLVRPANISSADGYPCREYIPALFGEMFNVTDTSSFVSDGWIVTGKASTVEKFGQKKGRRTLSAYLSDCGVGGMIPKDGAAFYTYYSITSAPSSVQAIFRQPVTHLTDGISACPLCFSVMPGTDFRMKLDIAKVKYIGSKDEVPALSRDTTVIVPAGPFKVKNSGTGKTNLFSQQTNNYLVLKEEDGKGIWGVPFDSKICGAVACIDYYANGKIQFLFASGSSLYLIDRLGRFVKPFPVNVGKEILIGPAAYDFTGAHGYTAVVLHKDNTIGMYDLHGRTPSSWKGIKTEDTIKSLPELIKVKGKRYWAIRTSVRVVFYGFDGGKPVFDPQGDKMIRPDSKINVRDDGSVSAICYDGKERVVKL